MSGQSQYVAIAFASNAASRRRELHSALSARAEPGSYLLRSGVGVNVIRLQPHRVDERGEAEKLRHDVAAAIGDPELTAGVSERHLGAAGAHFGLVRAEWALALGRALYGHGRTVHFEDLGPYRLVLNQQPADIRALIAKVLGRLIADSRNAELIATLESYLRHAGILNAVAREGYMHRNTVRNRLRRIVKLLDGQLNDPDYRLALQLALLARRALTEIEVAKPASSPLAAR